jgi:hypothetical protein
MVVDVGIAGGEPYMSHPRISPAVSTRELALRLAGKADVIGIDLRIEGVKKEVSKERSAVDNPSKSFPPYIQDNLTYLLADCKEKWPVKEGYSSVVRIGNMLDYMESPGREYEQKIIRASFRALESGGKLIYSEGGKERVSEVYRKAETIDGSIGLIYLGNIGERGKLNKKRDGYQSRLLSTLGFGGGAGLRFTQGKISTMQESEAVALTAERIIRLSGMAEPELAEEIRNKPYLREDLEDYISFEGLYPGLKDADLEIAAKQVLDRLKSIKPLGGAKDPMTDIVSKAACRKEDKITRISKQSSFPSYSGTRDHVKVSALPAGLSFERLASKDWPGVEAEASVLISKSLGEKHPVDLVAANARAEGAINLLARDQGRIVGVCLGYGTQAFGKDKTLNVGTWAVTQSMQKSGIGSMLFGQIMQEAKKDGYRHLTATTRKKHMPPGATKISEIPNLLNTNETFINWKLDLRKVNYDGTLLSGPDEKYLSDILGGAFKASLINSLNAEGLGKADDPRKVADWIISNCHHQEDWLAVATRFREAKIRAGKTDDEITGQLFDVIDGFRNLESIDKGDVKEILLLSTKFRQPNDMVRLTKILLFHIAEDKKNGKTTTSERIEESLAEIRKSLQDNKNDLDVVEGFARWVRYEASGRTDTRGMMSAGSQGWWTKEGIERLRKDGAGGVSTRISLGPVDGLSQGITLDNPSSIDEFDRQFMDYCDRVISYYHKNNPNKFQSLYGITLKNFRENYKIHDPKRKTDVQTALIRLIGNWFGSKRINGDRKALLKMLCDRRGIESGFVYVEGGFTSYVKIGPTKYVLNPETLEMKQSYKYKNPVEIDAGTFTILTKIDRLVNAGNFDEAEGYLKDLVNGKYPFSEKIREDYTQKKKQYRERSAQEQDSREETKSRGENISDGAALDAQEDSKAATTFTIEAISDVKVIDSFGMNYQDLSSGEIASLLVTAARGRVDLSEKALGVLMDCFLAYPDIFSAEGEIVTIIAPVAAGAGIDLGHVLGKIRDAINHYNVGCELFDSAAVKRRAFGGAWKHFDDAVRICPSFKAAAINRDLCSYYMIAKNEKSKDVLIIEPVKGYNYFKEALYEIQGVDAHVKNKYGNRSRIGKDYQAYRYRLIRESVRLFFETGGYPLISFLLTEKKLADGIPYEKLGSIVNGLIPVARADGELAGTMGECLINNPDSFTSKSIPPIARNMLRLLKEPEGKKLSKMFFESISFSPEYFNDRPDRIEKHAEAIIRDGRAPQIPDLNHSGQGPGISTRFGGMPWIDASGESEENRSDRRAIGDVEATKGHVDAKEEETDSHKDSLPSVVLFDESVRKLVRALPKDHPAKALLWTRGGKGVKFLEKCMKLGIPVQWESHDKIKERTDLGDLPGEKRIAGENDAKGKRGFVSGANDAIILSDSAPAYLIYSRLRRESDILSAGILYPELSGPQLEKIAYVSDAYAVLEYHALAEKIRAKAPETAEVFDAIARQEYATLAMKAGIFGDYEGFVSKYGGDKIGLLSAALDVPEHAIDYVAALKEDHVSNISSLSGRFRKTMWKRDVEAEAVKALGGWAYSGMKARRDYAFTLERPPEVEKDAGSEAGGNAEALRAEEEGDRSIKKGVPVDAARLYSEAFLEYTSLKDEPGTDRVASKLAESALNAALINMGEVETGDKMEDNYYLSLYNIFLALEGISWILGRMNKSSLDDSSDKLSLFADIAQTIQKVTKKIDDAYAHEHDPAH